jgi:hypothetical protein
MADAPRDRDPDQRPRSARPRDGLGRPLERGQAGVERQPEGIVRSPEETLAEARRLLADGWPFHAHEVFEDAWKNSSDADRELWRGLAQVAVGITHAGRGNRGGARTLLRRGGLTISTWPGHPPAGLDVDAVLSWIEAAIVRVDADCPVMLGSPPLS